MVVCSVQSCSNQSRLNSKCLLLQNIMQRDKRYKRCLYKGKWLPKTIHNCSVHFMEDHFDESEEMKRRLFYSKLKYLLKLNGFITWFPKGEARDNWGSSNIEEYRNDRLHKGKSLPVWLTYLNCQKEESGFFNNVILWINISTFI